MTESWRDKIKVHPLADLFPMLPPDELRELAEDIKTNLLREVVVFSEDGLLIDGRNRLAAMELAGMPFEMSAHSRTLHYGDVGAYIISKNIRRRHLTKDQQVRLIIEIVKAEDEFSKSLDSSNLGIIRQSGEKMQRGRPKDLFKDKILDQAAQHQLSKRRVERVLAEEKGRPAYPSRTIRPDSGLSVRRDRAWIVNRFVGFAAKNLDDQSYENVDRLERDVVAALRKWKSVLQRRPSYGKTADGPAKGKGLF